MTKLCQTPVMKFNASTMQKINAAELRLQSPIVVLLERWITTELCTASYIALKLDISAATVVKLAINYGFADQLKANTEAHKDQLKHNINLAIHRRNCLNRHS